MNKLIKRLMLAGAVTMVGALGFAGIGWAQEAASADAAETAFIFNTFSFQKLLVPARKFVHPNKAVVVIDNADGHLKDPPSIGIAVFFRTARLKKFPDKHLAGTLGWILADVDGVFGLLKRIPFVKTLFENVLLAAR